MSHGLKALLIVLALTCGWGLVVFLWHPREPRYQGKPLPAIRKKLGDRGATGNRLDAILKIDSDAVLRGNSQPLQ